MDIIVFLKLKLIKTFLTIVSALKLGRNAREYACLYDCLYTSVPSTYIYLRIWTRTMERARNKNPVAWGK